MASDPHASLEIGVSSRARAIESLHEQCFPGRELGRFWAGR